MCEFPTDQVLSHNGWFRDPRTGNWYKQTGEQLVFDGGWHFVPLKGRQRSIPGGLKGAISMLRMTPPPSAAPRRKQT